MFMFRHVVARSPVEQPIIPVSILAGDITSMCKGRDGGISLLPVRDEQLRCLSS